MNASPSAIATATITISNTGTGPLHVTVPPPKTPPFTETGGGAFMLPAGGHDNLVITYSPKAKGKSSDSFKITSDDPTHKKGIKVKINAKSR